MLKDVKASRSGVKILCWKLDRLARNLQDAALLTQLMQDGVISEILTPSSRYGNSSTDLFISGLDFLMAKKYIDDLSENVKRGLRTKVQMGWKPGVAPFGYKTTGEYRKGYRTLEPDPETFERVRMLWDQVLEHRASVKELVRFGRSIGLTVSNSKIYSMLTNPFYYGHFLWNGELYPGKHMPMVTINEFKQVQQHLGRVPKKPRETLSFTFRGLITCGECGGAITAEKKRKYIKRTKETREYIYYHCTHNKSNHECRQLSVTEGELMRQITAKLESISVPIAKAGMYEEELYKKELKKALKTIPSATDQKTSIESFLVE